MKRSYSELIKILCLTILISCARPPQASDITLESNPNPNAPLAGILKFKTDKPVIVDLSILDGDRQQNVTPDKEFKTDHEIMVLGLRPGRSHKINVLIRDQKGYETSLDPFDLEMPPLPEDFPPIALKQAPSGMVEPGVTMFSVFRWTSPFDDDGEWGVAVAVDEEGEVIWYLKTDFFIDEPRRMRNGNLLLSGREDGRLHEIDMLGNFVGEWHTSGVVIGDLMDGSIPVQTDMFHHDVIEISNGNFIGLGLEVRALDDFPAEYPPGTKRQPANVAGDVIVEFARDGNILRSWPVLDILDPERLGDGSLDQGFYEDLYKDKYDPLPYDLTHSNALFYIEEEDAVIVSSYRLCAIYKVDMQSGALVWILGDPVGWKEPWSQKLLKPKGDLTWPCHQHGLEMTPEGNLLMYDNGGSRSIPPQEPMPEDQRFSRAVEYRVNDAEGTVEEIWSYGPDQERFVSPFICDADYLPETGNILIADGGRFRGPNGEFMVKFGGHQWARILEVTHTKPPQKLWEIVIDDPDKRYSVYRAQRLRNLYPQSDRPTG